MKSQKGLWGVRPAGWLALLVLLGCFSSAHAGESGKLLVWINGDKGYTGLGKVGDSFTKATGIPVTVEHPEDAAAKFQQAAAAGKGPDVWIWAHDRLGGWVSSGLLAPIQPSAEIKNGIDPVAWNAFELNGKVWGYPLSVEAIGLIYNKSLVAKPPATFEEIAALDKELAAKGKKAIIWDYNNTYFTWPLLAANGGFVFGRTAQGGYDTSKVGVNNAGALAGAEMLLSLINAGLMPKGVTYSSMEAEVSKGRVAMMISGAWAWDNMKASGIDFGVAPIPSIKGKPCKPFVGVQGAMISASSPNKELAVEFLEKYVLTLQGLKTINADVPLGVPANKAFYAELSSNPLIKATMANVKAGEPMPSAPEMGEFWAAMASALENITQGRQAPKEALDAAAVRIIKK